MTRGRVAQRVLAAVVGGALAAWTAAQPSAAAQSNASTPDNALHLRYDVRVAWLNAGQLTADLRTHGERYELEGEIATSGVMDRVFKWRGTFAATGRMVQGHPHTTAYLLFEEDGKGREMVLATRQETTIHATGRASETLPAPQGSDLMSVLFLASHCVAETTAHDGEDVYHVHLARAAEQSLRQKEPYYSGSTERCDYRFRYEDGTVRRISLWMADWRQRRLPVRIRIRVPLLPDVVLRLRQTPA